MGGTTSSGAVGAPVLSARSYFESFLPLPPVFFFKVFLSASEAEELVPAMTESDELSDKNGYCPSADCKLCDLVGGGKELGGSSKLGSS